MDGEGIAFGFTVLCVIGLVAFLVWAMGVQDSRLKSACNAKGGILVKAFGGGPLCTPGVELK